MDAIRVYEVELNLLGTDTPYRKIYFLGYSVFQVSHMVTEYLYDGESDFRSDSPVEIGTIRRVPGISDIVNPFFAMDMLEDEEGEHSHGEFDGSQPIEIAKQLPDEAVMTFKCSCHEEIRVPQGFFPYVVCPNCENKILRREIKNAGGIYYFERDVKK